MLSLSDAALLAGLLKAPSAYSPERFPLKAVSRRNRVLNQMTERGFITSGEASAAKAASLEVTNKTNKKGAEDFSSAP